VVTADNQKAAIEQGTEIPYVTPGSANSPATVASRRRCCGRGDPQITPDNRIIMTVEVRKQRRSFVDLGGGFRVPLIDTRNVVTVIHINNGDTAVIGGISKRRSPMTSPGAGAGRHSRAGLPVQDDRPQQPEAGAVDLPTPRKEPLNTVK
jgi:type II secretory pathway component HofQ